jgi:hypothetical protein
MYEYAPDIPENNWNSPTTQADLLVYDQIHTQWIKEVHYQTLVPCPVEGIVSMQARGYSRAPLINKEYTAVCAVLYKMRYNTQYNYRRAHSVESQRYHLAIANAHIFSEPHLRAS